MEVKINLNPHAHGEAYVAYSTQMDSYKQTKKEFQELGDARKLLLRAYMNALEEHGKGFMKLLESEPVKKKPAIYGGIMENLQDIDLEISRIKTAVTKTPQVASVNSSYYR